jgi:GNAT superfamily N-acetyltransferase
MQATRADAPRTGATFGLAFAEDPVWRWLVGERAGRVVAAITQLGCERQPEQFTIVDGAAAWWHPPGHAAGGAAGGLVETLRLVPRVAPIARWRSTRLLRMAALVQAQHPREPHVYLGYLGAAVQGQGLGAQVLQPVLDRCDENGWPLYLESSNPRNLPFYRRHGFVEGAPLRVPDGCPVITPMWRR